VLDLVEIPQPRQARLFAGQVFEHILADLRFGANGLPDSDFVDLPVQVSVGGIDRAKIGPSKVVPFFQASGGELSGGRIRRHQGAVYEQLNSVSPERHRYVGPT